MRTVAFILSLLVLSLAIMPYPHSLNGCDTEIASNELGHSHDDPSDHQEECPPFCVCSLSVVAALIPEYVVNQEVELVSEQQSSIHVSSKYDYSYSKGVWQPPTAS